MGRLAPAFSRPFFLHRGDAEGAEDFKFMSNTKISMEINWLTDQIIGAAIEVHRFLGPGLLESAYEACMAKELSLREISFERQKALDLFYKGDAINCGYRLDFLVSGQVVVELKSVEHILPIHHAQTITYLKIGKYKVGLLINFNVPVLRQGLKRFVYKFGGSKPVRYSSNSASSASPR